MISREIAEDASNDDVKQSYTTVTDNAVPIPPKTYCTSLGREIGKCFKIATNACTANQGMLSVHMTASTFLRWRTRSENEVQNKSRLPEFENRGNGNNALTSLQAVEILLMTESVLKSTRDHLSNLFNLCLDQYRG